MMDLDFNSYIINSVENNYTGRIEKRKISQLPDNDVLVKVKYSSLNYKDALSAAGKKGIAKSYPHTPGIDAAGIIEESKSPAFAEGEKVIITGFGLGMNTPGGFSEYVRVPADWVIKLPENMTLKESMILGTAGFTAALAIYKLEKAGLKISDGEILVTGATGSLGSLAVALLAKAGYKNITAATGKIDKTDLLKRIGAVSVVNREEKEIDDKSNKALIAERWSGVIDSAGGNILATAIKSTKAGGNVAVCGLTQSFQLNTTVYPFILRGINLIGIDSAECPMDLRKEIWKKLSNEWKIDFSNYIYEEISLIQIDSKINLMLEGKNTGRIILNLEK